jgi:twitching motility protein PilT
MANPSEKTRAYRAQLAYIAAYQALKDGNPVGVLLPSTTVNISSTGALINTASPSEIGSAIRLQLHIPGHSQTLLANCRVIRVEEKIPAQKYWLGLQFEKIDPSDAVDILQRLETMDIRNLLEELLKMGGSDLHLTTNNPPIARVRGHLKPMRFPVLKPGEIRSLVYSIMSDEQICMFEKQREMDMAYSLSVTKRFRLNVHWQRNQVETAIRCIPAKVTHWEKLGLPPVVVDWTRKNSGLILVVGPTGSGKTTTLNSLVEQINEERDAIVICLERPIEYIHQNKKAVIKQREVGSDTLSFAEAVRRALRQDPDVIVVGEIDDAETAQVVLNAAETGTLVLASFHATNTVQAIDRFATICSPEQRQQASFQLASCLQGVLTQYLIPREQALEGGLALATEVFVPTSAGRNIIRNNTLSQLPSVIETGGNYKMHTLERSIMDLIRNGQVAEDVAESFFALARNTGAGN